MEVNLCGGRYLDECVIIKRELFVGLTIASSPLKKIHKICQKSDLQKYIM
jgi:hypothetical protein